MAISIKFPFKETQQGGVFKSNATTLEAIQTNLISLLTTKRKNRVMRSQLFSPLFDYIFEIWDDISATKLKHALYDKIAIFIPEIEVTNIVFNFIDNNNLLEVKVVFNVVALGLSNEVNITIPVEPGSASRNEH